jgi:hypothetical protein
MKAPLLIVMGVVVLVAGSGLAIMNKLPGLLANPT